MQSTINGTSAGNERFNNTIHLASRLMRHEHLQTVVILIAFLLFFFSWPILHFSSHYFSAADLSQSYTLFNLRANYIPGNPLLSDTFVNSQPWLMFNRDSLQAGYLPLWNPYNANGMPHMANYQSAVFSLFSLPYYFLDIKAALLISAFTLLFTHGFFSYAFLRQIRVGHLAALIGTLAFMFAGYNVLWLGWLPVVASGVSLPVGFFFIEQVFQQFESGVRNPSARIFWPLVGFSLSLVVGLLAGHPETFYTALLLIATYTAFRILCLLKDNGCNKHTLSQLGRLSSQIVLASALAAGVSAIQLIPFLEYLLNSAVITNRTNGNVGLDILPLLFFPNLLGSPSGNFRATLHIPFLNYNESDSFYIGSLIVFLALLSVIWSRHNRYIRFFAATATIWFLYFFNIFGVDRFLKLIPGISLLLPNRSHIIWLFSLSCCAALSIDYLSSLHGIERLKRWWLPVSMIGLAMVFITFGILQALTLTQQFAKQLLGYNWLAYVPAHMIGICLTFGIGVLALAVLYQTEHYWIKTGMCGIILLIVFWQGGYQFKTHNPITENSLFYPLTSAIQTIQKTVGNANTFMLGNDTLPADSNLVYRVSMLTSYDALWVAHHDRLFHDMFSTDTYPFGAPTLTFKASSRALKLFGVEYVVTRDSWLGTDTALADIQLKATKVYAVGEIMPGKDIIQTFTATENGLSKIMLMTGTYNRVNQCRLALRLELLPTHTHLLTRQIACDQVLNDRPLVLTFDPITNSKNKNFQISISSIDGKPGNAVTLMAKSDLEYQSGTFSAGGQAVNGGLWFDFVYGSQESFKEVATAGSYSIYKYTESLGKYFSVANAIFAGSDEEAWTLVHAPSFDPEQTVIINNTTPATKQPIRDTTTTNHSVVQVVSQEATSIKLKVTQSMPSYLVLTMTYYPGWKARVNGVSQPVQRANYAFSAIKLDSAESDVEFYYDPDSVRYGFAISTLSLICGIILIIRWLVVKRRNDQHNT